MARRLVKNDLESIGIIGLSHVMPV